MYSHKAFECATVSYVVKTKGKKVKGGRKGLGCADMLEPHECSNRFSVMERPGNKDRYHNMSMVAVA